MKKLSQRQKKELAAKDALAAKAALDNEASDQIDELCKDINALEAGTLELLEEKKAARANVEQALASLTESTMRINDIKSQQDLTIKTLSELGDGDSHTDIVFVMGQMVELKIPISNISKINLSHFHTDVHFERIKNLKDIESRKNDKDYNAARDAIYIQLDDAEIDSAIAAIDANREARRTDRARRDASHARTLIDSMNEAIDCRDAAMAQFAQFGPDQLSPEKIEIGLRICKLNHSIRGYNKEIRMVMSLDDIKATPNTIEAQMSHLILTSGFLTGTITPKKRVISEQLFGILEFLYKYGEPLPDAKTIFVLAKLIGIHMHSDAPPRCSEKELQGRRDAKKTESDAMGRYLNAPHTIVNLQQFVHNLRFAIKKADHIYAEKYIYHGNLFSRIMRGAASTSPEKIMEKEIEAMKDFRTSLVGTLNPIFKRDIQDVFLHAFPRNSDVYDLYNSRMEEFCLSIAKLRLEKIEQQIAINRHLIRVNTADIKFLKDYKQIYAKEADYECHLLQGNLESTRHSIRRQQLAKDEGVLLFNDVFPLF